MCPTNLWSSIARIAATLAPWHAEATPSLSASNSLDPNSSEDLEIRIDQAPTATAPTPAGWTHEQAYLIERLERERKGRVRVEVALAYVEEEGGKTEMFLQGLKTAACAECGDKTCCTVCLEAFVIGGADRIVRLPCHREHVFHEACMWELLIGTTRCPLDRQVLIERGERPSVPRFFCWRRGYETLEDWTRRLDWYEERNMKLTGMMLEEYWGDAWECTVTVPFRGSMRGG